MAKYYSLKQIARDIGLNYSTARAYVNRFHHFFRPMEIPGQRWPVYDDGTIETLRFIANSYKQGQQGHDILGALEDKFGTIIELEPAESKPSVSVMSTTTPSQVMELLQAGHVGIDYALGSLQFYKELVEAKDTEIVALKARIADLEATRDEGDRLGDVLG